MKKHFYFSGKLSLLVLLLISTPVLAQNQPFQIALVTPVQIVPANQHISGIRLNLIYGRNMSVTGLDVGCINHTTDSLSLGIQYGIVGLNESDFTGWQNNIINITQGNCEGLQCGIFNSANHMNGIQFGFVNYAVTMKGFQIGVVNIIKKGGQFPVFPIVNWSI